MNHVVVVGGGLVGASTAYRLACAGAQVTLVDRGDEGQATAAGAGIVFPSSRSLQTRDLEPLVKQANAYYPQLISQLADDGETATGYEVVGALHVARDETEAAQLPDLLGVLEQRRDTGFGHIGDVTVIDPADALALFPALAPVAAAVHMPAAARVDGRLLRDALRRAAQRRGATALHGDADLLRDGERATGVRVGDRTVTADAVIVAGGAWSGALADRLGIALPVYPQRGQIVHLLLPDADTSRWPVVVGFHSHYLLTFPRNRVVAGATREDGAGYDHRLTVSGVHEVLGQALRLAPGLGASTVQEIRIGFRPASRDHKPVLGPAPGAGNVHFATGHGASGLQLGPYSGALVADLALGTPVAVDLEPFAPGR